MPRIFVTQRPARETRVDPMNQRAVVPAVSGVLFYSGQEAKRVMNALAVGQIQALLYVQKKAGTPCTCTGDSSLLTTEGNLASATILDYLLTGKTTNKPTFTADDISYKDNIDEDLDDPDSPYDVKLQDEAYGYSGNVCAVCYGSGFVGGFDIAKHSWITLATPSTATRDNVDIDTSTNPHSFVVKDKSLDAAVTFQILVPVAAKFLSVRLMNNTEVVPAEDYVLSYPTANGWVETKILDGLATGQQSSLKVKTKKKFTHLDVLYRVTHTPTYIDFPQLRNGDLEKDLRGDHSAETDIVMGVDATNIRKYSLVYDFKYKRFWQIQNLTTHQSGEDRQKVVYIDAEARVVQPQEILALPILGMKV